MWIFHNRMWAIELVKKDKSQMSFRYNNVSDVRLVTQQSIYMLILIIDPMKYRFYFVFLPKKTPIHHLSIRIVMVEQHKRNHLFA